MRRFARPLAALLTGAALLAGVACSDSSPSVATDETRPPDQETQAPGSSQPNATPTTSTAINRATNELSTADLVKLAEPSVVRVETNGGVGTGFVVAEDGYIMTNNHVVQNSAGRTAAAIRVTLSDGSVLPATVVGADPKSDLAILKVDRTGLKALQFADLDTILIGQDVVAIGYALDLRQGEGPSFSVTRGIVSQKNRAINEGAASAILGAVQTDAAINHGNSGGPLLNLFGEVVGINTALAPDGSGGVASGIGFAVGSDVAKAVYEQIRESGSVDRGLLGISQFESLRPAKAKELNIPDGQGGLIVNSVSASGPVGAAGLRAGDVITRIGDATVAGETDLAVALIRHGAGETVTVEYFRNGEKSSIEVTLGAN
jgi:S1-C subfamily serine protease